MRAAVGVFLALSLCGCGGEEAASTRDEETVQAMLVAVQGDCDKLARGAQRVWRLSRDLGRPPQDYLDGYYRREGGADAAGAQAGLAVIQQRLEELDATPPEVKAALLDLYSAQTRLCELSFDPGDFNLEAYGNQLEILNSQLVGARSKLDVLLPATADRMTLLIPYRTAFNEARVAYQKEQAARSKNPVPQVQVAMESLEATPLEDPLPGQDPEAWPDLPQPNPVLEPLPAGTQSAPAGIEEMTGLAEMSEMPEITEASTPAEPAPTIQVRTPKAGRLIPTLPDWHKRYQQESAPARDAFTRVADRLRSGELPGSADCESLSTSARRAFPALKAPDTHIAGSLSDAYRALVDLGEACERGQQIGAMGLLSLAEAKLGNAEKAMRRQGLAP
jgi:hypothetical protein